MTGHSNSVKMTIEERIAQELKSDRLGALLEDDELQSLVKNAIRSVFEVREMVPNKDKSWNAPANVPSGLTVVQSKAIAYMQTQINETAAEILKRNTRMSKDRKQTEGEYRVGIISFNPSDSSAVDEIKRKTAELIDLMVAFEEAALWAEKAATKQPRE